jgi:stress-induced morphogen
MDAEAGARVEVTLPPGPLGISFEWSDEDSVLIVTGFSPLPNSGEAGAAEISGLVRAGTELVSVNGELLKGMSFDEVVSKVQDTANLAERMFRFEHRNASDDQPGDDMPGDDAPMPQGDSMRGSGGPRKGTQKKSAGATSMLDKMKTQRLEREAEIEEKARIKKLKAELAAINPVQTELKEVIENGLDPLHLDVMNTSFYMANRNSLGIRPFWYRGVEKNKNTHWWDAHLFFTGLNEKQELIPKRVFLGTYKTEAQAVKKVEQAALERNAEDPEGFRKEAAEQKGGKKKKKAKKTFLNTHYQIQVVSNKFRLLNALERTELVYNCLMAHFNNSRAAPAAGIKGDEATSILNWKGFTYVGPNVVRLPHFNFLNHEAHFAISCLTPAQWNPKLYGSSLTDRFGPSHVSARALGNHSKTKVPAALVKQLEDQQSDPPAAYTKKKKTPVTAAQAVKQYYEMLNSKGGGMFSHFYHGLTEDMQKVVKAEHIAQLKRVGQDGYSSQKKKKLNNFDALSKMFTVEEVVEPGSQQFSRARQVQKRSAQMVQRALRGRLHQRTLKYIHRRHLRALHVERTYRGYRGRIFCWEYRRVMTVAAIAVQAARRAMLGRIYARKLRAMLTAFALAVQPHMRAYLTRQYIEWVRQNSHAGMQIQRMIRGFVTRQVYKRLRARRFFNFIVLPAVLLVQASWRMFKAKLEVARPRQAKYLIEQEQPAAATIERVYRGYCGREVARWHQRLRDAAVSIQGAFRMYRMRKWWKSVLRENLEKRMATRMQCFGRTILASKRVKRRMDQLYRLNVIIPCCVKLQTAYRCHLQYNTLKLLKLHWANAIKIQQPWRRLLKRRQENSRWEHMRVEYNALCGGVIQRIWRGYLARSKVMNMVWARHGEWGAAVLKIQACWRGYLNRMTAKQAMKMRELEELWQGLLESHDEHLEIDEDMKDCKVDISNRLHAMTKAQKRIRILRRARLKWQYRIPEVEEEMDGCDDDDVEGGWAETFENEWQVLNNSMDVLDEELLGRKIQRRETFQDLEELYLEKEDLERDLDENVTLEALQYEKFRRLEITRGEERRFEHRKQAVRLTRNRWKIQSTRTKVIERTREDLADAKEKAKRELTDAEVSTVSFEKKHKMRNEEKKRTAVIFHEENRRKRKEIETHGVDNEMLRQTYANVIGGSQRVLKEYTYELRRPKSDLREDRRQMCWHCGLVYCTCPEEISNTYQHAVMPEEEEEEEAA